ncbi:MAG: ATP-binding cassette domain-containing protein [Pseudomonadota bacterium]
MQTQKSRPEAHHPVAELRGAGVTFAGQPILRDINLTVAAGSIVAVIGASGSGKSTLLRLLNGLQDTHQGEVYRHGQRLVDSDLREVRQRTGYALQQIGLLPHLSIASNIALPLKLAGWDAARQESRVQALADLMQLSTAQLARYPHELSGGQQQRAGLCRAMALRPDLLLLDEAFSGLDAITRVELHEAFLQLRGVELASALLVTHDLAEADRLADWLVILQRGRIVRQGPRDEVLADPQDDYAARLIETFIR